MVRLRAALPRQHVRRLPTRTDAGHTPVPCLRNGDRRQPASHMEQQQRRTTGTAQRLRMMAWAGARPCATTGCSETASGRSSRCTAHTSEREWQRGSATARGYGMEHKRTRAELLPTAIGTPCPLCGHIMQADDALDLDHTTPLARDRTARGDRICHASCNRGRRGG